MREQTHLPINNSPIQAPKNEYFSINSNTHFWSLFLTHCAVELQAPHIMFWNGSSPTVLVVDWKSELPKTDARMAQECAQVTIHNRILMQVRCIWSNNVVKDKLETGTGILSLDHSITWLLLWNCRCWEEDEMRCSELLWCRMPLA